MKHVIVDFDNTMGVKGRDVDDGFALLYLLGNSDLATIEAACTTYGNSNIETVHENTLRLFGELGLDIPVYKGAASTQERQSEAASFLAKAAAERPGELSILATGSLTNLYDASLVDPRFFDNLREIVVMGGITETLAFNGHIMNELNFSCDPEAATAVLCAPCKVSVAVSKNCLPASFSRGAFLQRFAEDTWLYRECSYWFEYMSQGYEWTGFTCWDLVAAAYLVKPELFEDEEHDITVNPLLLKIGYLETAAPDAPSTRVNMPRIIDAARFRLEALDAWEAAAPR